MSNIPNDNKLNDIIEDFNNDKNTPSLYTLSSDEDCETFTNSDSMNIKLVGNKRNDEFLFYNHDNSATDSKDDIESSEIDTITLEKSYYTSEELYDKKDDIIKLFYIFDVVIFTDDYRIKLVNNTKWFCFLKSNSLKYINPDKFPGILFLPFSSINLVKKIMNRHNKTILMNDSETCNIKFKYQICFDEGDIYKNMVYKKIQIQNKLLFVPMSKYQLKLTEYKLRGFCQIMEELGAIEIEIEFNHEKLESTHKKIEVNTSDYKYIAGTLGFSASSNDSDNKEITYKLIYPKHNTFILNSKIIKKKIATGKYIINKKNFDSNLELQYIIESRCRHFITNYSTVFTLDNSISYDSKLMGKLESHNFNLGFETNNEVIKNLKLSINTKVKFCNQKDSYKNLLGDNVSWDSIGFNYLLGTLNQENFNDEGIYKIIFFIHKYIDKVIYQKNRKYYHQIKKLYKYINKEFSFEEYKDILLNYFNINSHWLHFLNFIDILVFKSVSYDKLGFLILMSQSNIESFKKHQKIINFIRHMSANESTETQFWEMLEPNNYYLAITKLSNHYDVLSTFNWFNLKKLLHDLTKYKPIYFNDIEKELSYADLYNNFILGHMNTQFEKNLKPFIIKFININFKDRLSQIDTQLSPIIFNIIRPRHLLYYNINTEDRLKQLIDNKFTQIEEGVSFYEDIYEKIKDHNRNEIADTSSNLYKKILLIIKCDHFKDKYPTIYRKINYILDDYTDLNKLVIFCSESNMFNCMKRFCSTIIKKIILFDYKFNIKLVDLNVTGYQTLLLHIKNINESTNINLKVEFFIRLCNFIIKEKTFQLSDNTITILDIPHEINTLVLNSVDFNSLADISFSFLNNKFNLNLEIEFYRLIK